MLFQWASYYKNIYEMLPNERPPQTTIDNDFELDRWQEAYTRDLARSLGAKSSPFFGEAMEKIPKFGQKNAKDT